MNEIFKPVKALKILCGVISYLIKALPSRRVFAINVFSKYQEIFSRDLFEHYFTVL